MQIIVVVWRVLYNILMIRQSFSKLLKHPSNPFRYSFSTHGEPAPSKLSKVSEVV
jgi:hypothetical protein